MTVFDKNKVALLFPGQGSQTIGMGKDFFENFTQSKQVFEEASDTIHLNLKKLCFDGPASELMLTENLQPALFVTEAAILAAIASVAGLKPVVCAGHSLGEYSALHACGSLSVSDGVRLTQLRGRAMQNAVPIGRGTMSAILGLDAKAVDEICAKARASAKNEPVEPANYNAPGQIVIAGTIEGVANAAKLIKESPDLSRARVMPLQVSAPFHCSLMLPAQKVMAPLLASTRFKPASCSVIPNVTAIATHSELEFAGLLTSQITHPVRWEQSMRLLKGMGVNLAIEVGPGKVLSGLLKRIEPELSAKSMSSVLQLKEILS